jgi:hypothetical protein
VKDDQSLADEIHALLVQRKTERSEGYARPSAIARGLGRSLSAVYLALRQGEEGGRFVRRPVDGGGGPQPSFEWKANSEP